MRFSILSVVVLVFIPSPAPSFFLLMVNKEVFIAAVSKMLLYPLLLHGVILSSTAWCVVKKESNRLSYNPGLSCIWSK
jgi:hypothetical protein